MVKRVQSPQQEYLFSSELKCSDVRSLPLITENRGFYEVWAPGSVYQPILAAADVGEGRVEFSYSRVLVSTSSLEALSSHAKFNLRDEAGNDCAPSETDFKNARIVFQKDDASYIEKVLNLLIDDTQMDSVLKVAGKVRSVEQFAPASELDYDLALRVVEFLDQTDCEFAGVLVREYLKPDASGRIGTWVQEKRRGELNKYSKDGFWGVGAEKAKDIREHPAPCEELWKRKQQKK